MYYYCRLVFQSSWTFNSYQTFYTFPPYPILPPFFSLKYPKALSTQKLKSNFLLPLCPQKTSFSRRSFEISSQTDCGWWRVSRGGCKSSLIRGELRRIAFEIQVHGSTFREGSFPDRREDPFYRATLVSQHEIADGEERRRGVACQRKTRGRCERGGGCTLVTISDKE